MLSIHHFIRFSPLIKSNGKATEVNTAIRRLVGVLLGSTNLFVGIRLSAVRTARANGGVQRGVTPLAHWGVFSMSEAVREENALMS